MIIEDGTGDGYIAGVNKDNRLEVIATAQTRVTDISEKSGEAFLIASDFISLTDTGIFNALVYIKNTSEKDVLIDKVRTCSSGSGSLQLRIIMNPTAGTIVDDANAADRLSSNSGSNKTFSDFGLAYAASAGGKTITDGDNLTQFINRSPGHSIQDYSGSLILARGGSMAITCKPSTANTVCVEVQLWMDEK